ncbi:hypothetical protein XA68_16161 [Ophiocordyceps unilateralis]|uniref:Protein kinase domain-containing protein n=1 Tax=Ophiocordyceps unilateralis TaxID=268505 RepID=A0A2A9PLP5_OPHUN|nr:hypothetical protein XA68_16161 [Ophiocordyceps unilateralis]
MASRALDDGATDPPSLPPPAPFPSSSLPSPFLPPPNQETDRSSSEDEETGEAPANSSAMAVKGREKRKNTVPLQREPGGQSTEERERLLLEKQVAEMKRELETVQRQSAIYQGQLTTVQRQLEAKNQETRKMTLEEYLLDTHELLYSHLPTIIETNPKLITKNTGYTNVDGKTCPDNIQMWTDFPDRQNEVLDELFQYWPHLNRVFEKRVFLEALGERVRGHRIASEDDMTSFLKIVIEDSVKGIVTTLKKEEDVATRFKISDGIRFQTCVQGISRKLSQGTRSGDTLQSEAGLMPDRFCLHDAGDHLGRTLIHVTEIKPPTKLTKTMIRDNMTPGKKIHEISLRLKLSRSNDVSKEQRDEHNAKLIFAAAVTQTYHYMIRGGVDYGVLTQGELFVFLKINWNEEPGTLYYHIADPQSDVEADPGSCRRTALGQYLAFTLMAVGRPSDVLAHGQDEIDAVERKCQRWKYIRKDRAQQDAAQLHSNASSSFETANASVPSSQSYAPPDSQETESEEERINVAKRGKKLSTGRCKGPSDEKHSRKRGPPDDDEQPQEPPSGKGWTASGGQQTQHGRNENKTVRSHSGAGAATQGNNEQDRPYCTQKCLSGLVSGGFLDADCPNTALHRGTYKSGLSHGCDPKSLHHSLSHVQFLDLLWKQLKRTLDKGISPLNLRGARGVLFKVTLLEYGYTMVSKGTVEKGIKHLHHEAEVYQRLQPIQGKHVPVYLGAIDLRTMDRKYYYGLALDLVYMLFLAWGGKSLYHTDAQGTAEDELEEMAKRSLRAVHGMGVVHQDVRLPNMLVNDGISGVMVIDFERSSLLEPPRRPLMDKPKRQLRGRTGRPSPDSKKRCGQRRSANAGLFSQEIRMLACEFTDWRTQRGQVAGRVE